MQWSGLALVRKAIQQGLPVDSALVLVSQQCETLPETLPEVLEQWPVNGLHTHTTPLHLLLPVWQPGKSFRNKALQRVYQACAVQ